jgi:hypothetical protein
MAFLEVLASCSVPKTNSVLEKKRFFRFEVQKSLAPEKPPQSLPSRLVAFLNTGLGLWFLSTILQQESSGLVFAAVDTELNCLLGSRTRAHFLSASVAQLAAEKFPK